jgi:hypothetical protein
MLAHMSASFMHTSAKPTLMRASLTRTSAKASPVSDYLSLACVSTAHASAVNIAICDWM